MANLWVIKLAFQTYNKFVSFTGFQPQEATPEVQGGNSPKMQKHPIAHGIFKAKYGGHGIEYINLNYKEQSGVVFFVGTKVTGDPYVPAGKRTFKGRLSDALVMESDQQVGI